MQSLNKNYPAKERYQDYKVAQSYDKERFSSFLGRIVDRLEKHALNKALKHIDKNSLILDLPCGTGRITEFLLQKGYFVVGADISEAMIAIAKEKLQKFSGFKGIFRTDAENLSFLDKSFDYSVSVRLMGHLPPDIRIKILQEMRRVTKKQIVVTFYITDLFTKISKFIQRKGKKIDQPLYPIPMRYLEDEISKAGLKIVKIIPMLKFISECHYLILEPKTDETFRLFK